MFPSNKTGLFINLVWRFSPGIHTHQENSITETQPSPKQFMYIYFCVRVSCRGAGPGEIKRERVLPWGWRYGWFLAGTELRSAEEQSMLITIEPSFRCRLL